MKSALIVGLGGFLGSVGRFKLGGVFLHQFAGWRFPLGTFVINVAGCLIIGLLAGVAEHRDFFSPDTRLFLFTGLLGGFTTFSAFGYEAIYLLRRGEVIIFASYVVLSVVCGLLAVWVGHVAFGSGAHHKL
jgi:CrcB protein